LIDLPGYGLIKYFLSGNASSPTNTYGIGNVSWVPGSIFGTGRFTFPENKTLSTATYRHIHVCNIIKSGDQVEKQTILFFSARPN